MHEADHGLETCPSLGLPQERNSGQGDVCPTTEELGPPGEQRAFVTKPGRDAFAQHV